MRMKNNKINIRGNKMKKEIKKKENKNLTKSKKQLDIYMIVKLFNENIIKYFSNSYFLSHYELSVNKKQFITLSLPYPLNINTHTNNEIEEYMSKVTVGNVNNDIILKDCYLRTRFYPLKQRIYFFIDMLQDNVSYQNIVIILKQIFTVLTDISKYFK